VSHVPEDVDHPSRTPPSGVSVADAIRPTLMMSRKATAGWQAIRRASTGAARVAAISEMTRPGRNRGSVLKKPNIADAPSERWPYFVA
jgi:hypothetical protein